MAGAGHLFDQPMGGTKSERQAAEFMSIKKGDPIILKKNQEMGVSMRLNGHGRVTGIR
jgi:hypothetical protein